MSMHKLTNNKKGQYALDLEHPYRLSVKFEEKDPSVIIIKIVDYH